MGKPSLLFVVPMNIKVHLTIVCGCFCNTTVELIVAETMWPERAKSLYHLVLYRKTSPILALDLLSFLDFLPCCLFCELPQVILEESRLQTT